MLDLTKLPAQVVEANREFRGLDPQDTSQDGRIAQQSARETFRRFCEWEGLVGWSSDLWHAVKALAAQE